MNPPNWYATAVAAGLCSYMPTCGKKAKGGRFCNAHRKKANARHAVYLRETYVEKKVAGDCVRVSCKEKAAPDLVLCEKHKEKDAERYSRPTYLESNGKSRRKIVEARLKAELCGKCGAEPLVTKTMGEKCRQRDANRSVQKYAEQAVAEGREVGVMRCLACRKVGHRIERCQERELALPALHIEDFIYRRGTDPNQEAHESA